MASRGYHDFMYHSDCNYDCRYKCCYLVILINPNFQKGYSDTRCSIAMLFDDLLNGNYTRDGS